jgi:RNA polymerase-binding transcription factor DksA
MTKTEQEGYRQQLLDLGRRLRQDMGDLADQALRKTGGEASGSLSNAPVHLADLGSDAYEQEVSVSLLQNQDQTLQEIAAALTRLEQGTYGRCEECGKDISKERLQAVPYTRLCVTCARRSEGEPPPGNL